MEDLTIEAYLAGKVGFDVAENAITTILVDRDIDAGMLIGDLTKKQRDLCTADLYMWCASTPSVTGKVRDADGNWSHEEGGHQSSAFDKRNLRQMANDIYKKYGETTTSSGVKLVTSGMKVWRR